MLRTGMGPVFVVSLALLAHVPAPGQQTAGKTQQPAGVRTVPLPDRSPVPRGPLPPLPPLEPDLPDATPAPPGVLARLGPPKAYFAITVYAVAFSPDGKTLAAASSDKVLRLWEVATGKELRQLGAMSRPVFALAF